MDTNILTHEIRHKKGTQNYIFQTNEARMRLDDGICKRVVEKFSNKHSLSRAIATKLSYKKVIRCFFLLQFPCNAHEYSKK